MRRCWAALDKDGYILNFGVTWGKKFDRRCFSFTFGGFGYWLNNGARYCEVLIGDLLPYVLKGSGGRAKPGLHVSELPHGRIRKSRDKF